MPSRAPALEIPSPSPLVTRPLGREAWRTMAIAPARDALAVATAEHVILLSLPSRTERWRHAVTSAPRFLAFSRDGSEVAALGRTDDARERLVTLAAADGAARSERVFEGLRSPPEHGDHGIQPPPWPTALMPADGQGWWITNAYGVFLAAPGSATLTAVDKPGDTSDLVAAQDGRSYWGAYDKTLKRLDGDAKTVVTIDCYAQTFVIDPGLDRAATTCWESGKRPEVLFIELSSGKALGRFDAGGDLPELAIADKDRLLMIAPWPSAIGTASLSAGGLEVSWQPQAGGWDAIEYSPSGARAVGVGGGSAQVIELASGKVVCDHGTLGAGMILAAGFAGEDRLWTLSNTAGGENSLEVADARVDVAGCHPGTVTRLGIGKTTNLAPRYASALPGFVLNALIGTGYGLALVDLRAAPSVQMLLDKATPAFSTSDDGARIGAVDSQGATVFGTGFGKPAVMASFGELAHMALCGGRILTYRWNEGWTLRDDSGHELTRFDTPQPEALACRGRTFLVADRQKLLVIDLGGATDPRPKVVRAFTLDGPVATMAIAPDGGSVLLPGGGTGWRRLALEGEAGPPLADIVASAQAKLRADLARDFPADKIEVRQEDGPFDTVIAVAAFPGAYPGSGVRRLAIDRKTGLTYGRGGERGLADFARLRGWLQSPPETEALVRFVNTLLFDGIAILDGKAEARIADGRLVIKTLRHYMPSGSGETLVVTIGAAGPEVVERVPLEK